VRIFYSWQSDLPGRTNRNFIEAALERAAKQVSKDDVGVEAVLDRDTANVAGSPDIAQTIFEKIRASDAFVADVSIINGKPRKGRRATPNPNVLVELGFAAECLGWDKVIVVNNAAFGREEDLPFDVRGRRIVSYKVNEVASDQLRAEEKKALTSMLVSRIRDIRAKAIEQRREEGSRIDVQWVVEGKPTTSVEIAGMPDLADFSAAFRRRFDTDELEYLQRESPQDVGRAEKYNADVAAALADDELRAQWLRYVKPDRHKRAAKIDLQVVTGDEDLHDLLIVLAFPDSIEVFRREQRRFEDAEPPKLPTFPKLDLLEKRRRSLPRLWGDLPIGQILGTDIAARLNAAEIASFRRGESITVSEHKVTLHIRQMSRRRRFVFDDTDGIRLAGIGEPGEYKVTWRGDAAGLPNPIEGELVIVVKKNSEVHIGERERPYIGASMEEAPDFPADEESGEEEAGGED
jgi:hypothetical protein